MLTKYVFQNRNQSIWSDQLINSGNKFLISKIKWQYTFYFTNRVKKDLNTLNIIHTSDKNILQNTWTGLKTSSLRNPAS